MNPLNSILEKPFWANDFWGCLLADDDIPFFHYVFRVLIGSVVSLFILIAFMGISEIPGVSDSVQWLAALGYVPTMVLPALTPYNRTPTRETYPNSSDLRKRLKEYYSLDSSDRARYPYNIVKLVTDDSLTPQQRSKLDDEMQTMFILIEEKNKALNLGKDAGLDLTPALDWFKESREGTLTELTEVKKILASD